MRTTITLLSAMAVAASLSFAQDKPAGAPKGPGGPGKPQMSPEKVFEKLDTNQDKSISLDEFKASPRAQKDPAKAEEAFKKMDTDGKDGISLEEFKASRPAHAPGKGGPGKGGRGKGGAGKGAPAPAPAPAPAGQ